jgi:hypothetical protein
MLSDRAMYDEMPQGRAKIARRLLCSTNRDAGRTPGVEMNLSKHFGKSGAN